MDYKRMQYGPAPIQTDLPEQSGLKTNTYHDQNNQNPNRSNRRGH